MIYLLCDSLDGWNVVFNKERMWGAQISPSVIVCICNQSGIKPGHNLVPSLSVKVSVLVDISSLPIWPLAPGSCWDSAASSFWSFTSSFVRLRNTYGVRKYEGKLVQMTPFTKIIIRIHSSTLWLQLWITAFCELHSFSCSLCALWGKFTFFQYKIIVVQLLVTSCCSSGNKA